MNTFAGITLEMDDDGAETACDDASGSKDDEVGNDYDGDDAGGDGTHMAVGTAGAG